MKSKILTSLGIGAIAMALFFYTNAINDKNTNVDLASLITISNANAEENNCQIGGLANLCCPYWNVTITWTFTGPKTSCTTGGLFKCKEC
ncbi:hypothetical protein JL193_04470 [Polaribacter batillariae]|uniref:NVEALA protein n=1 Tax=Polaribacter batillariae TaxID=2808900 RepID=A0ABX7SXD6_9FLAO|nr:hypothetical protein [Polaribacter batillariae]QTD38547.1 hypothetical protein JL193_04470 [Polaribacter batillariae]